MLLLFNDFLKDLLYESNHSLDLPDPGFTVGFQGFCRMSRLYVFTLKPSLRLTMQKPDGEVEVCVSFLEVRPGDDLS